MKKITTIEFINKCIIIHNNYYDYSLTEYINSKSKIEIICPIHGIFEQIASDHKNGSGCPKCAIIKNTNKKKNILTILLEKVNKIHNNTYDYSHIKEYNNMHDNITVKCKKHGYFNTTWHYHINKNRGCPVCNLENRTDTKHSFLIKSTNIHTNKYDYSLVEYINSKTKVKIICPIHGIFEQRPRDHINSKQCCPKCNTSKGENEIIKYLEEKRIKYIHQMKFDNCKYKNKLPFDFYLPDYNICIEYDGLQHYESIEYFGGEKDYKLRIEKDKIKTKYCQDNNIILERIIYSDNIIEKLENILF